MTALTPRPLDNPRLALADRIARRLIGRSRVDTATREAVTLLTASADPGRAERLAVRPGEPGPLVERLAVWALRRVPDDAVARAERILDADALLSGPEPVSGRGSTRAPAGSADAPADAEEALQAAG